MISVNIPMLSLGTGACIIASWSLRAAQSFARRMPKVAQRPLEAVYPSVAAILPIKGVEADTAANIAALLAQDYPNYRLIFSVESELDPVLPLLRSAMAGDGRLSIVIAGETRRRGQKIHNQLAAVAKTGPQDDILAFMDADAQPGPTWLHALVVPLTYGSHIGATTGYRFYVPASRHPANALLCVINAGVASLLGPYRRTLAWGGSMAIRRADFYDFGLPAAWKRALSDDYGLSYCVKHQARRKIHFVPQCMVLSRGQTTWGSLLEFGIRQYRITRVCVPLIWLTALTGRVLYLTALAGLTVQGLVSGLRGNLPGAGASLVLAGVLYLLSLARGWYLLQISRRLLPASWPAVAPLWAWFTLAMPLVALMDLILLLGSAYGRRITWRGIRYQMLSRSHVRVETRR